jgi:hypothetical protein
MFLRKRTCSSISHSLNVRQVHVCFGRVGAINLVVGNRIVVEVKAEVIVLPNHWVERLHHGNVMGGERVTRGTRGTHSESAEANVEVLR